MNEDREEAVQDLAVFLNSKGFSFLKDMVQKHLITKADELKDLLRQSNKSNDYMIYRVSGYLDGYSDCGTAIEQAIEELNRPQIKPDKPIY